MELSNTAKEVLVQAASFKLETGNSALCVEHILYGILLLAKYYDPPFDEQKYREDGQRVRELLEKQFQSVAITFDELKDMAANKEQSFQNADAVLGRASELARSGRIGAEELTRAVLEANTPTIARLKNLKKGKSTDDKRYEKAEQPAKHQKKETDMKDTDKKNGLTASQEAVLAALLLAAISGQQNQASGKKKQFRQRTKMGIFTYRGGKVAAIIQYFLFGIVVPALPLAILQITTGFLQQPHAPWISFIVMAYVSLWVFYLGRGLSLVFGLISSAFGNFLDITLDLGLIAALVKAVTLAFGMPEVPLWLRIVSCLTALLILFIGNALYDDLKDNGDKNRTRIILSGEEGTPDKIFFHAVTKLYKWPLIGFSIWWILELDLPVWAIKALWIAAFALVYYIIWVGIICNGLRYENSRRHRKGGRLAKFFVQFGTWMFIPALVLALHRIFGWFPMKLWVIIVLSIYTLFFLISSIGVARMKG